MSDDDQLARLLRDTGDGIEPTDRWPDLLARTTRPTARRSRWAVPAAAALAAAAAVAAFTVLSPGDPRGLDPADTPSTSTGPTGGTDPSGSSTAESGRAVAAYFIGDTPRGERLYREFQQVPSPVPGLAGMGLLEDGPVDPDYASAWPAGSFGSLSDPEAGVVHLELTDAAPDEPSDLALQQLAYTVTAGFGDVALEVVVHGPSGSRDDLGPVVATVSRAPQLEVLALVNLSEPSEGQAVDDVLPIEGVASSYEATVLWRIEQEGAVVDDGFVTAAGYLEPRLFPFSDEIDVSSLDPGSYTLIVETDDPSGGTEGFGATTDTRTFTIE